MPTYEYRCSECNNAWDEVRSILSVEAKCPLCGHLCKPLISGGSTVIFRGGGFHSNDYAKDDVRRPPKPGEPNHKAHFTPPRRKKK